MIALLFWIGAALVAYTYLVYPLLAGALARRFGTAPASDRRCNPALTVVIAARNEQERIVERIRDLLRQDYPAQNIRVLVVSDGSNDATATVALVDPRVRVIALEHNRGKAAALTAAMAEVSTEYVVFADARQRFAAGTLRNLMAPFADPRVGAVSGELEFRGAGEAAAANIGLYWRMEKSLRASEALLSVLHGVSGAVYALRTELFRAMPQGLLLDDMWVPLHVVFQGRRVWMARDAIAYDKVSSDDQEEFRRKLRTLAGNWQLIARLPRLLNPFANPVFFAWVSHKLLRLVVPWALIVMWVASWCVDGPIYRIAWWAQTVAYAVAILALLAPRITARVPLASAAATFVLLNAAALLSLPAYLFFNPASLWKRH